MKKSYFLLMMLILSTSGVFAQRVAGELTILRGEMPVLENLREVTDTISPVFAEDCDPTPILLSTDEGGWVTGGNGYGDLEKAQYFETGSAGLLYSVMVWVGAKEGGTGSESFSAKMHGGDPEGGPDATPMAVSEPVTYAELDTVATFTRFTFDPPVAYDGSFFVSLEVSNGNAIYGVVHTDDGCGNSSAWEMWGDESWIDINSAWGDLDIVMYILAEVEDNSVGIDDSETIEAGSDQVFPNPVTDHANLIYQVTGKTDVKIHVFSQTGVLIKSYFQGIQSQGVNQLTIGTEDYSPGMYIYSIETEDGFRNGKFSVIR